MSDSATLNHAARVLATVSASMPADLALRRYLTEAKRLRAGEKRAISRAVFTYYRWRNWIEKATSHQKAVELAVQLEAKFIKNTASVKPEAIAALAVPAWTRDEVTWPVESLRQLQREPALWLRTRRDNAEKLAGELGSCKAAAHTPWNAGGPEATALHFTGTQDLFVTPQFHHGDFEIQDLASQAVGYACSPKPGQTWWDTCAGEGGKTLHLADLMANKGLIWASDRSERRLQSLKKRAARAKIFNFRVASWDGSEKLPTKTKFDGVLVDAPCSGLGTWQRNPHARWTTIAADVAELSEVQKRLLNHVAGAVKPGGRLVYAVCTLTRSETTAVVEAFSAAHPEFTPVPVFANVPDSPTQLTLWPHELQANGMFVATWQKK